MRGQEKRQTSMLVLRSPEDFVPKQHPIRPRHLRFARSLNHVSGTLVNGRSSNLWVRWTACLERIDNVWLVEHDHVSIPADVEEGRAVMNLTP